MLRVSSGCRRLMWVEGNRCLYKRWWCLRNVWKYLRKIFFVACETLKIIQWDTCISPPLPLRVRSIFNVNNNFGALDATELSQWILCKIMQIYVPQRRRDSGSRVFQTVPVARRKWANTCLLRERTTNNIWVPANRHRSPFCFFFSFQLLRCLIANASHTRPESSEQWTNVPRPSRWLKIATQRPIQTNS